jgi:signal peptidase I
MAPTLMGRHKEIRCPECGFLYSVNASEEVESRSGRRLVYSGICSNCRFQVRNLTEAPSFKGDRILVMMFPYDLPFLPGASSPERWDVVVFRYPEEPEQSYIKRLIGLPGETIRIKHGDLFVKPAGGETFRLARKPLKHQAAMQMTVYDDRHRSKILSDHEDWRRWRGAGSVGWKIVDPTVSRYEGDATEQEEWVDLRYRHLVPDAEQWEALREGEPISRGPRASLITDFYSYNTNLTVDGADLLEESHGESETVWLQPHWVGDLTLSATVEVKSNSGEVRFELIKAGVPHQCVFDLATGTVKLYRGDDVLAEQVSPMKGPGQYQVEFANVDDRLTLVVNGTPIGGDGFEFDRVENVPIPTEADLSPAGIAIRRASATVSDLVLKRDIYYTQYPGRVDYAPVFEERFPRNSADLIDFLSNPAYFPRFAKVGSHDYEIADGRYMMLGDNSPRSKDSRGWDRADLAWDTFDRQSWEVPRELLTGKAFYVYWPHGMPVGPEIRWGRDIRLPFRPYFERMRWIR